jgi:hypothetical protein
MAGRRPGGLRSGDLNEELGILLLKSFATVAPVPHILFSASSRPRNALRHQTYVKDAVEFRLQVGGNWNMSVRIWNDN